MLADEMCMTKEKRENGLRGSSASSLRNGDLSCEVLAQAWMKSCLAGLLCCQQGYFLEIMIRQYMSLSLLFCLYSLLLFLFHLDMFSLLMAELSGASSRCSHCRYQSGTVMQVHGGWAAGDSAQCGPYDRE